MEFTRITTVLALSVALALGACSSDDAGPTGPTDDNIEGYPLVPRPAHANYWDGTQHNSQLLFEGGVVDLRNLVPENANIQYDGTTKWEPMPRRLALVEDGVTLTAPHNPKITVRDASFWYIAANGPEPELQSANPGRDQTAPDRGRVEPAQQASRLLHGHENRACPDKSRAHEA